MDKERVHEAPGAIEDQAEVEGHLNRGIVQTAGEQDTTDLTPGAAGAAAAPGAAGAAGLAEGPEVAGHGLPEPARGATEGAERDEAARNR